MRRVRGTSAHDLEGRGVWDEPRGHGAPDSCPSTAVRHRQERDPPASDLKTKPYVCSESPGNDLMRSFVHSFIR